MSSDAATNITRRAALSMAGAAFVLPAAPLQSRSLEKQRMTFAPKFIDLVRNYTTTNGTSDFDLGPAVNGFASFTDVCVAGDTFYYSATGIDNPSEYEVGRGTLDTNGKIIRDPINGTKTAFSNGTKSLSLITAAEWYAAVDLLRSSPVNVKSFGAKGDSNDDGSVGTDDTAAIQAALDYVGSRGGGTIYFPEGTYKTSTYLNVPVYVILRGAGRKVSRILGTHAGGGGATPAEGLRNGSILYSGQPVNTSTRVDMAIEDLWLASASANNQGAGFYNRAGVVIAIRNCEIGNGCKYGVVLEQSENVLIQGCELGSFVDGGAGLWLASGAGLDADAMGGFTNIIAVHDTSLNVSTGSYGAIDDGGYVHRFQGCDFNGGINGIRANGVIGLTIDSCYAESQIGDIIELASTTLSGVDTGGNFTTISGGQFSAGAGCAAIRGVGSPGSLIVNGGSYSGGAGTNPLCGAVLFAQIFLAGPNNNTPVSAFADGSAGINHLDFARVRATEDGRVGVPNRAGTSGGITLTPGSGSGMLETFNSSGVRQGYGFSLSGTALQFAAQGSATSFQFLSPVSSTGSLTSSGGGVGYSAGAGGTVIQPTSKSTGVTLNKPSGQITLAADAVAPGATVSFKLTNSQVAAGDVLILNHVSGGTIGAYRLNAHGAAVGSVTIDVTNSSTASLSESITIGFAVVKAVTA